jgi:asparagine synthase (glutamine-hydrolysing)
MCGLAGLFVPRGCQPTSVPMARMLDVMRHRGPDGMAEWKSADGAYHAGFARLAIIDLATGDQPLVENGGARVLMGNGEIYNYRELRAEEADYPYTTQGDMEAVLAVARHGDDFVTRLNGMFALALYDGTRHRLTLIRDRLGIKPIYWAETTGGAIVFASEIKALLASGLIAAEVDEAAVSAYLGHGFVPGPASLYRGIRKVMPGHAIEIDADGTITRRRYWRPRADANLPKDADGIRAYLAELLSDSLRLQQRSDVPIGALLSGGLDSGLMVAMAAAHLDRPLNTFTVRFAGADYDETPLAEAVAKRYGTNHKVVEVEGDAIATELPRLVWHCEEPLFDAALLPNYLIERALAEHVTVALNGTGGDELFAGYGRYFQLPVERHYLALPKWLRQGVIAPAAAGLAPETAFKLERAERFANERGAYLHMHLTQFPAPFRALIGNGMAETEMAQSAAFDEFSGEADTGALYADLLTYLPDDLLTLLDRTSMAVSVEGRVPLLDHRFVEAALAVPSRLRTGAGQKALQRDIAKDYLPAEVVDAPKQGFRSPVPQWMAGSFGRLAKLLLLTPEALARGWWTRDGIERLFRQPGRNGYRIYTLAQLELTVRMFADGPVLDAAPTESLEHYV